MSRFLPSAVAIAAVAVGSAGVAQAQSRVEVTAAYANVRSGPGTSNRIVGTVERGTRMVVLGSSRGWYNVDLTGLSLRATSGYIATSLVREVFEAVNNAVPPEPTGAQEQPQPVYQAPAPAYAEETPRATAWETQVAPPAAIVFRFYGGVVPWAINTAGQSVRLNGNADSSPVPSLVEYREANQKRIVVGGLGVQFVERPFGPVLLRPELGVELGTGGGIWLVQGMLGGVATFGQGRVRPQAALRVGAAWRTGKVGEVGSTSGDVYLRAPDGNEYEIGSSIETGSSALAVEPAVGVELPMGSLKGFAEIGYRAAFQLGDWRYTVSDPTGTSEQRSSKLPASGFSANPPELRQSGPFVRLGVGVSL